MLSISINASAQAVSLVVDNQTPGWLSSKINYGDQLSVVNLKITGYINEEDMIFLKGLEEKSLKVLDLEDVHTANVSDYEDDQVGGNFFSDFNTLEKLITPRYVSIEGKILFYGDSLIVKSWKSHYSIGYNRSKTIKEYLELPEGVEEILYRPEYNRAQANQRPDTFSVVVPSTVKKLIQPFVKGGNYYFRNTDPNLITITREQSDIYGNALICFNPDTLFVPTGCKNLYRNSFNNYILTNTPIIELAPPSKISLNKHSLKAFVGDSVKISASIYPTDAYFKGLKWKSTNPEIASVSQSGEIFANNFGIAKIIVYSEKDESITDTCMVSVYEHVNGVVLSSDQIVMNIDESEILSAKTLPEATTDNEIIWSSSNPDELSITSSGKIVASSIGTYIVTATSVDGGYKAECVVNVVQPAKFLTLYKHEITIRVGEYEELNASISPDNTTNKEIKWLSSNEEIAEVSSNGLVKAKSPGVVYIKAVAISNPVAKDSCEARVIQPVTGVMLNESAINFVEIGEMRQLVATVLPDNASDKTVKWESSNTSVCTVSSSGIVVAVGYGTSVITVTTVDGGFVAVCVVNISEKNGILNVNANRAEIKNIYNICGKRRRNIQKGVNIIRMEDGTTKKIIMN